MNDEKKNNEKDEHKHHLDRFKTQNLYTPQTNIAISLTFCNTI